MISRKLDTILAGLFFILTILFIVVVMNNKPIFDWVFERHHNQWSWYLRPLFLLPFCYFAYKRSLAGMMFSIFALFTSMFWFPKPENVSKNVVEFLNFEKEYLLGQWNWTKSLLTLTIPFSFLLLGLAFWKRNLWLGLGVIILMAIGKILWSIQSAGIYGKSILFPAILGLVICFIAIYLGFKKLEKKNKNSI